MLNPMTWGLGLDGGCSPWKPQVCYDPLTVMTVATVASTAATAVGTGISAMGTLAAGKQQQQAAQYEALQLDAKGKQEQAAARVDADELGRKKDLALSSLQTKAAGSGFSASDPTSLALADEIAKYGTLQEQMAMYGGTSRRAGLEAQAEGRRFEGDALRAGSKYKAMATILGGVSTIADRFAPKTPSTTGSSYRYG